VIHKPNGGLASARNAGMQIMTGKYLFFLDSDDWLELNGLEKLYTIAEQYKVDFVRYRAIRSGWPGLGENAPCMVENIRELDEGLYEKNRIVSAVYPRLLATNQLTMGAVVGAWGSLYRVEFLKRNNLKFYEEVKFSEDLIFSANVVKAADSFYFVNEPCVYHYFYNSNSISKSFREGRWESCKSLIRFCEQDFRGETSYNFDEELDYLRWFCIMLAINEKKYLKSYHERKNYCRKIVKDNEIGKAKLNLRKYDVSWKQKLLMIIIKFRLYPVIGAL